MGMKNMSIIPSMGGAGASCTRPGSCCTAKILCGKIGGVLFV